MSESKISPLKIWLLAARPKTLAAAICPVVIGTAMAYGDGIEHFPSAILCLITALLIQIGTNLANDYFDFINGADTQERIGPTRVTQAGLVDPKWVCFATFFTFFLALVGSYFLIKRGGWPIGVIGVLSIISGIFYTAGPRPLGYLGLGDIFVLIFFGPVAVAGTYFVQTFEMNYAIILAGFGPGLLSTAILAVNNMRDIDSDEKTGKHTLAVRFGRSFAQTEYMLCILLASLLPVLIFLLIHDHHLILITSIISVFAIQQMKNVNIHSDGTILNQTLAATGKLLFIYSILFSLGWIL